MSHHLRMVSESCSTHLAVLHAASARKRTVTTTKGESLGDISQSSRARGRELVKISPQYPAGRERLVLRAQRRRCRKFPLKVWLPMRCSITQEERTTRYPRPGARLPMTKSSA